MYSHIRSADINDVRAFVCGSVRARVRVCASVCAHTALPVTLFPHCNRYGVVCEILVTLTYTHIYTHIYVYIYMICI